MAIDLEYVNARIAKVQEQQDVRHAQLSFEQQQMQQAELQAEQARHASRVAELQVEIIKGNQELATLQQIKEDQALEQAMAPSKEAELLKNVSEALEPTLDKVHEAQHAPPPPVELIPKGPEVPVAPAEPTFDPRCETGPPAPPEVKMFDSVTGQPSLPGYDSLENTQKVVEVKSYDPVVEMAKDQAPNPADVVTNTLLVAAGAAALGKELAEKVYEKLPEQIKEFLSDDNTLFNERKELEAVEKKHADERQALEQKQEASKEVLEKQIDKLQDKFDDRQKNNADEQQKAELQAKLEQQFEALRKEQEQRQEAERQRLLEQQQRELEGKQREEGRDR